MISFKRNACWTGRSWLSIRIGKGLHIGFGPHRFIERIQWGSKLIYPKPR